MCANHIHRKPKGSDGRAIHVGLVGPKPRPEGVGDGDPVNIPGPAMGSEGGKQSAKSTRRMVGPGQACRPKKGVGKAAPGGRGVKGSRKTEVTGARCQEKPLNGEPSLTVPQTDTGGWVENTKVNGETFVKELDKLTP